jgi:hypothetical protein
MVQNDRNTNYEALSSAVKPGPQEPQLFVLEESEPARITVLVPDLDLDPT